MDKAAEPELVAQTIYKAANDNSNRMRYLVGKDAKMFWTIRRYFGENVITPIQRPMHCLSMNTKCQFQMTIGKKTAENMEQCLRNFYGSETFDMLKELPRKMCPRRRKLFLRWRMRGPGRIVIFGKFVNEYDWR